MSSASGRLAKELVEVGKDDETSGVRAVIVNDRNPHHLKGTIMGPQGTPYEGGVFEIDINIPKQYPFEPPKMKFSTKIWHPNISSQTGAICLVRPFVLRLWMERRSLLLFLYLLCASEAAGFLGTQRRVLLVVYYACVTFCFDIVVLTLVTHR